MKKIFGLIAAMFLVTSMAFAENPVQLSVPGANLPEGNVKGARLSLLYGETDTVKGLNVSVLGLSDVQNFTGLQLGLWLGATRVQNEYNGVSLSLVNWQDGNSVGANLGLVNYVNNLKGLNWGAVNITKGEATINLGLVNVAQGTTLIDIGFVNYAERTTFQLGLVNATKNLDGVQIGLINYAENGIFPVLPIVNFTKSL